MGFYDKSCFISGLSLKLERADCVILMKKNDDWVPVSPLIDGRYNRLGVVDVGLCPRNICEVFNGHEYDDRQAFLDAVARGEIKHDGCQLDVVLFHWRMAKVIEFVTRKDPEIPSINRYDDQYKAFTVESGRDFFRNVLFDNKSPGADLILAPHGGLAETWGLFSWMNLYSKWEPSPPDGQHFDEEIIERFDIARERVKDLHPRFSEWIELAIKDTEKAMRS